jgi:hypothetical protein
VFDVLVEAIAEIALVAPLVAHQNPNGEYRRLLEYPEFNPPGSELPLLGVSGQAVRLNP